jgi:hypothetical protein
MSIRDTMTPLRFDLKMISRRMVAAIALCGVATPSMARDLIPTLPHVWVSATALSLTLITAANRPKR